MIDVIIHSRVDETHGNEARVLTRRRTWTSDEPAPHAGGSGYYQPQRQEAPLMKRRRAAATAALLTATALTLTACTGGPQSSSHTNGTGTLTVGFNTPPVSLDPLKAANGQGRWYEDPAYSSVLNVDNTGKVIAGLATKWGYVGTDNKHFSFTLRSGLKFADGSPVTAQAVVNSFNAFVKGGSGPTRAYFLGMTATAASTTVVNLASAQPDPIIPTLLGPDYYAFSPISPAGLKNASARASKTFGVGPYVLDSSQTVSGDHYTYVKNPNYYDKSAAHFSKIVVKVIPNAAQLVQAEKTGQVQVVMVDASVANTATGSNVKKIARIGNWDGLVITDRNGKNVPALKSKLVRQAIAYSLDRTGLATAALGKYGKPSQVPTLPGDPSWGYDASLEHVYDQNVSKAKSLLAQAGYPNGFSMSAIYQSSSPTDSKLMQGIASQLSAIGIKMTLKAEPNFGAWVNDFVSGKYSATTFGDVGLPMYLLAQFFWTPKAIINPYGVSDPDVNAAFSALSAAPASQQADAAKAVTRAVVENADTIPVLEGQIIYLYDKNLRDVSWIGQTGNLSSITSWTTSR